MSERTLPGFPGAGEAPQKNLYRFISFAFAIVLAVSALGARMFWMQIVDATHYAQAADAQTASLEAIPANRGLIYDAEGNLLVRNVVSYSVKIVPKELPLSQRPQVVARLAELLNLDPLDITTRLDSTTSLLDPVRVARDVPVDVSRVIEEDPDALPGVHVVAEARREYTNGPLFGQLLGYTGPVDAEEYATLKDSGYEPDDMIGKAGLEAVYEDELRGKYGVQKVSRDAAGNAIPGMVTPISPVQPGDSLRLSINSHEQELAAKALTWAVNGKRLTKGVIIVMNPQTGEVLAMVSLPGYDDNLFARGISTTDFAKLAADPDKPLVNKAISEQAAPGSTFKMITGTAGLADGRITDQTRITTKAYVQVGGWRFWDWNKRGWGPLNIYNGFGESSDTFFYQLAQMVGLDRLSFWAKQYGLGSKTGVDLPGEVAGVVPSNEWKLQTQGEPMYGGDLVQMGIGQGFNAVTPLQLLDAYCALANGGKLYQPQIVHDVVDGNGNVVQPFKPILRNTLPTSQKVLQTMRLAARRVVTIRHTFNLVDLPIKVAGKTGTAEFGVPDKFGRLPYHDWFVGFVPGDPYNGDFTKPDSQLAVLAMVWGSNGSGNNATEVVKYFLWQHFNLPGDPFSLRTRGHINTWVTRQGNFYSGPSR